MSHRPPNAEELKIFNRFRNAVVEGRASMRGYLGACETMAVVEQWRRNQIAAGLLSPGVLPIVFTKDQVEACKQRVAAWNYIESALSGLEIGRLGFQVGPNKKGEIDINIFSQTAPLLGGLLVLLSVGAVIVLGGIAAIVALKNSNLSGARKLKWDLAQLNQRMAAAPQVVRDAFKQLQKSTDFTEPKSAWDKLTEGIGKGAMTAVLAVAGVMLLTREGGPLGSPRPNPCGQATPDDWNVKWSDDPEKAERQLEHVLGDLSDSDLERRWGNWFEGYGESYGAGADEVPF